MKMKLNPLLPPSLLMAAEIKFTFPIKISPWPQSVLLVLQQRPNPCPRCWPYLGSTLLPNMEALLGFLWLIVVDRPSASLIAFDLLLSPLPPTHIQPPKLIAIRYVMGC